MAKPCKWCESVAHSSLMCFKRPRTPIKSKRKTINRLGKVTAKWIETRHEWIQQNMTTSGIWRCYYGQELLGLEADPDNGIEILTLDHKQSRTRHPELRFDLNNLVPSCAKHNSEKGSKSAEEYIQWLERNLEPQNQLERSNAGTGVTTSDS